jgi:uncharacterized protein DUF6090
MKAGKTGRYLKYAIGEIVLVVVGILIALSINNWNEDSKNKSLETDYLNRIIQDLDNDLAAFEETIIMAKSRNERVLFLQQAFKNPDLATDSSDYFVESIIYAGFTFGATISHHTFDELKSSGRLVLINNKDLRLALAKYYSTVLDRQWNYLREDVQNKYRDYSAGVLNSEDYILVLKNSYLTNNPVSIKLTQHELDEVYKRFKSKLDFQQLLPRVFEEKFETIIEGERARLEARKLKIVIQNELNGRPINKMNL